MKRMYCKKNKKNSNFSNWQRDLFSDIAQCFHNKVNIYAENVNSFACHPNFFFVPTSIWLSSLVQHIYSKRVFFFVLTLNKSVQNRSVAVRIFRYEVKFTKIVKRISWGWIYEKDWIYLGISYIQTVLSKKGDGYVCRKYCYSKIGYRINWLLVIKI